MKPSEKENMQQLDNTIKINPLQYEIRKENPMQTIRVEH